MEKFPNQRDSFLTSHDLFRQRILKSVFQSTTFTNAKTQVRKKTQFAFQHIEKGHDNQLLRQKLEHHEEIRNDESPFLQPQHSNDEL